MSTNSSQSEIVLQPTQNEFRKKQKKKTIVTASKFFSINKNLLASSLVFSHGPSERNTKSIFLDGQALAKNNIKHENPAVAMPGIQETSEVQKRYALVSEQYHQQKQSQRLPVHTQRPSSKLLKQMQLQIQRQLPENLQLSGTTTNFRNQFISDKLAPVTIFQGRRIHDAPTPPPPPPPPQAGSTQIQASTNTVSSQNVVESTTNVTQSIKLQRQNTAGVACSDLHVRHLSPPLLQRPSDTSLQNFKLYGQSLRCVTLPCLDSNLSAEGQQLLQKSEALDQPLRRERRILQEQQRELEKRILERKRELRIIDEEMNRLSECERGTFDSGYSYNGQQNYLNKNHQYEFSQDLYKQNYVTEGASDDREHKNFDYLHTKDISIDNKILLQKFVLDRNENSSASCLNENTLPTVPMSIQVKTEPTAHKKSEEKTLFNQKLNIVLKSKSNCSQDSTNFSFLAKTFAFSHLVSSQQLTAAKAQSLRQFNQNTASNITKNSTESKQIYLEDQQNMYYTKKGVSQYQPNSNQSVQINHVQSGQILSNKRNNLQNKNLQSYTDLGVDVARQSRSALRTKASQPTDLSAAISFYNSALLTRIK